jgi:hypothetical protein
MKKIFLILFLAAGFSVAASCQFSTSLKDMKLMLLEDEYYDLQLAATSEDIIFYEQIEATPSQSFSIPVNLLSDEELEQLEIERQQAEADRQALEDAMNEAEQEMEDIFRLLQEIQRTQYDIMRNIIRNF